MLSAQHAVQVMAQLPTLYKAAHVYLVSRRPPAVDSKAAVPLHVLLRALRSPLCAAAQWATHPGLRSAPILLKFLKNDAALAVIAAESDKADCAALFMHRYHNSFRTAMKALDSNLGGTSHRTSTPPSPAPSSQSWQPNVCIVAMHGAYPDIQGRDMRR